MKVPPKLKQSDALAPQDTEAAHRLWTEEDEEELRHFREMAKISREVTRKWMDELIRPAE